MHFFSLPVLKRRAWFLAVPALFCTLVFLLGANGNVFAHSGREAFLKRFNHINQIASTVPANGDVNPYGVVVVPRSVGKLVAGNTLVSNFNNKANQQGRGSTIVQISPSGKQTLFAQITPAMLPGPCPGGVGLTTALAVLKRGWVIVGSLPTANGTSATARPGCLIVLNSAGRPVETLAGFPLLGPWDATVVDNGNEAILFVTNVLDGTVAASPRTVNRGNVTRIRLAIPRQSEGRPRVESVRVIGTGFAERTDPAALVLGPTGVGLGKNDILYVADTVNSRIAAIPNALVRDDPIRNGGVTVSRRGLLNQPLGMAIAPNGHILTVNGGDGFIVETTPGGAQIASFQLDKSPQTPKPGAGCLFGIHLAPAASGVLFVDDCSNTLNIFH